MGRRRTDSDEHYVLALCGEVLEADWQHQHRFDFLRGDVSRGKLGRRLPVDGFFPRANLVIEYHERQHHRAVAFFDKPNKLTVSGVHRGEQRRRYDQRRRDVLRGHGIGLVEISYQSLRAGNAGKLARDREFDLGAIRAALKEFLPRKTDECI
jgi:hypothetical protein